MVALTCLRQCSALKNRIDAAGVHPEDLRSLAVLAWYPFAVKVDFRANFPLSMLVVPKNQLARVYASSGTTGKPTVVGHTKNDINVWVDCVAHLMRASGTRPEDTMHAACGNGLFTGGRLGAQFGADRLSCSVVPASGGMAPRQVRLTKISRPL